MDINSLFTEMEQLSPEQLERLYAYINSRPYKREGRAPTLAERNEVIDAIRIALLQAEPPDQGEHPAITRLREKGLIDD